MTQYIYFKEITYNNAPLIWEINEEESHVSHKIIAREIFYQSANIQVMINIVNPILLKIEFPLQDIKIEFDDNCFAIENYNAFLKLQSIFEPHLICEPKLIRTQSIKIKSTFFSQSHSVNNLANTLSQAPIAKLTTSSPEITCSFFINIKQLINKKKDIEIWRKTLTHFKQHAIASDKLMQLKSIPIASTSCLLHYKEMEGTIEIEKLLNKRLEIMNEIIKFFNEIFKKHPISLTDYTELCQLIKQGIIIGCTNKGLELPLDHETSYKNLENTLSVEEETLIKLSKELEIARARVIAQVFIFKNLPQNLQVLINSIHLKKEYEGYHKLLIENIVATGKQLKLNSANIDTYRYLIKSPNFKDEDYVSLDYLVTQVITDINNKPNSVNQGSPRFHLKNSIKETLLNISNLEGKQKFDFFPPVYIMSWNEVIKKEEIIFFKTQNTEELIKNLQVHLLMEHPQNSGIKNENHPLTKKNSLQKEISFRITSFGSFIKKSDSPKIKIFDILMNWLKKQIVIKSKEAKQIGHSPSSSSSSEFASSISTSSMLSSSSSSIMRPPTNQTIEEEKIPRIASLPS